MMAAKSRHGEEVHDQDMDTGQLFILNVQTRPERDPQANLEQADRMIRKARSVYNTRFDLICLPEYFSLGVRKKLGKRTARGVMRLSLDYLKSWARACESYVVGGTIPEAYRDRVHDTTFLLNPQGEVVARYRKIHLYADWGETAMFTPGGQEVEVVDLGFTKLGLAICRDLRFPWLFGGLSAKGAEIFCVPSIFNYPYEVDWEVLGRARALENQAYFVLTNITGNYFKERFFGRSMVVDYRGNVIALMDDRPGYQLIHIDLLPLREWRRTFRIFDYDEVKEAIHEEQVLDRHLPAKHLGEYGT